MRKIIIPAALFATLTASGCAYNGQASKNWANTQLNDAQKIELVSEAKKNERELKALPTQDETLPSWYKSNMGVLPIRGDERLIVPKKDSLDEIIADFSIHNEKNISKMRQMQREMPLEFNSSSYMSSDLEIMNILNFNKEENPNFSMTIEQVNNYGDNTYKVSLDFGGEKTNLQYKIKDKKGLLTDLQNLGWNTGAGALFANAPGAMLGAGATLVLNTIDSFFDKYDGQANATIAGNDYKHITVPAKLNPGQKQKFAWGRFLDKTYGIEDVLELPYATGEAYVGLPNETIVGTKDDLNETNSVLLKDSISYTGNNASFEIMTGKYSDLRRQIISGLARLAIGYGAREIGKHEYGKTETKIETKIEYRDNPNSGLGGGQGTGGNEFFGGQ